MTTAENNKKDIEKIISECERYRQQLICYCLHYDCTVDEAEDCVSQAFEAMLESLTKNIEIKSPRAWLYKVTLVQVRKLEKQKAKEKIFEFTDSDEKQQVIDSIAESVDFCNELVTESAINQCAVKIISRLDSNERRLYLLYYRKGKPYKEIAKVLDITEVSVRKRSERLKKKLHRLIKEYGDEIYILDNTRKGGAGNE